MSMTTTWQLTKEHRLLFRNLNLGASYKRLIQSVIMVESVAPNIIFVWTYMSKINFESNCPHISFVVLKILWFKLNELVVIHAEVHLLHRPLYYVGPLYTAQKKHEPVKGNRSLVDVSRFFIYQV